MNIMILLHSTVAYSLVLNRLPDVPQYCRDVLVFKKLGPLRSLDNFPSKTGNSTTVFLKALLLPFLTDILIPIF